MVSVAPFSSLVEDTFSASAAPLSLSVQSETTVPFATVSLASLDAEVTLPSVPSPSDGAIRGMSFSSLLFSVSVGSSDKKGKTSR
jgi:hypothetical protein